LILLISSGEWKGNSLTIRDLCEIANTVIWESPVLFSPAIPMTNTGWRNSRAYIISSHQISISRHSILFSFRFSLSFLFHPLYQETIWTNGIQRYECSLSGRLFWFVIISRSVLVVSLLNRTFDLWVVFGFAVHSSVAYKYSIQINCRAEGN